MVSEVASGIYQLETRLPAVDFPFCTYFVTGNPCVIIEPGPAALAPEVQAAATALELEVGYIIPTHVHLDHAGGLGRLCQLYPQALVVANPEGARHLISPERLIKGTRIAFGGDFEATYGPILPVPSSRMKVVKDREKLDIGGRELTFIYTPGHAPHHLAILESRVNGLFCGEALGLIYSPGAEPLPALAAPSNDVELYLANMEELRKVRPSVLFYSHGGVSREPDKAISQAEANTRLIRDSVLAGLRSGHTAAEITSAMADLISHRFGFQLSAYELKTNVAGLVYYFRKNGLA